MSVQQELASFLATLHRERPGTALRFSRGGRPPYPVHLSPWGIDAAEELHRQFGEAVRLTVGFLPYPPGQQERRRRDPVEPAGLLDSHEVTTELDEPAVVASGHNLRRYLLVRNLTGSEVQIATNGGITASVVDPRTGEIVGGRAGAQALPLKVFRADPGNSARIPLLIGTASYVPRLGYAIPPGEWGIQATLVLDARPRDAPRRRTPVLPLTITL